MSLGWQSESALLPSKATPINVDSKSMMGMKALVYKLEHNLSAKAAGREGATYDRKIPRHSGSHQDKKLSKDAKTKTKAVESRRDESDEISDKVAASLRAKAALYDQIVNGHGNSQDDCQLQNSVATSGSGAFLINFDQKRKTEDHDSYDRTLKNPKYDGGIDREGQRQGEGDREGNTYSSNSSSSSNRPSAGHNVRRRHSVVTLPSFFFSYHFLLSHIVIIIIIIVPLITFRSCISAI